ncbi:MAG: radical SAM protein [Calditrichaeota bacterium]|nr:radical SAM protein [Calditrichota bacterium]
MYRYLFGPVPSRRLGISLGIDLVPFKTCTMNCIYCECGITTDLTTERKEWTPTKEVLKELTHYFSNNPKPDFVTFSGSGEPTLHLKIGEILEYIRNYPKNFRIAVLTNGTLFTRSEVRKQVLGADVIIPSLDAATESVFKKINRPHKHLSLNEIIEGLINLRKEFGREIWLEVFIVPGLNDTQKELSALKQAILKINPDRVQLNTLDRPGAVPGVRAATRAELRAILDFWQLKNAEIIAGPKSGKQDISYRKDAESAILETIARRPCTLEDLREILGLRVNEINKYLRLLEADEKIKVVSKERGCFYRISG